MTSRSNIHTGGTLSIPEEHNFRFPIVIVCIQSAPHHTHNDIFHRFPEFPELVPFLGTTDRLTDVPRFEKGSPPLSQFVSLPLSAALSFSVARCLRVSDKCTATGQFVYIKH